MLPDTEGGDRPGTDVELDRNSPPALAVVDTETAQERPAGGDREVRGPVVTHLDHAVVDQRKHLKRSHVITAKVTKIDHASKTVEITPAVGDAWTMTYDQIVVTAGSVSRTFPIPGVADQAIGLKTIEEAVAIRDHRRRTSGVGK